MKFKVAAERDSIARFSVGVILSGGTTKDGIWHAWLEIGLIFITVTFSLHIP